MEGGGSLMAGDIPMRTADRRDECYSSGALNVWDDVSVALHHKEVNGKAPVG
jgi:hypothetical protein